jgi:hypothetical protein
MPTQTFDGEVYQDGQQFKDDARLVVRFFMNAIKHEFRSEQEGRPIFIDVPYIEVIQPGSRDTLVTEATSQYQNRFRMQWEAFQARTTPEMTGTPLKEVPWLTVSQVAELNALNVKTVEQLVNMPDSLAQRIMGSFQLRDRAKRFLEAAAGEAVSLKLEAEVKARQEQIDLQNEQIKNMQSQIAQLMESQKAAKPAAQAKA